MALFSERYGYVKVFDVIIRERITPEIQNGPADRQSHKHYKHLNYAMKHLRLTKWNMRAEW